jgi:class 3 adenylate cyclase
MTLQEQREELLRFLRAFAAFRRDLKYALIAHQAMDRVRLISEPGDVQLSRANGRLQEFPGAEGGGKQVHQRIRNHVVLKADVRGSTEITARLVEKNLNPASYFSLNFFGPINQLIEAFGARKTFIEGDAIILSIFEYEDLAFRWLSVAHACVLARKILEVIDAQNAQNRRHGLPDLELGIGIAFADGSPNFLYDGERQIMISPAINRADRLSSCAAALRSSALHQLVGGRGVEVVSALQGDEERLLRYNVNGIELEAPAYFKLKLELALKRVDLEAPGGGGPQRYFVGQAPDRTGQMHLLVLREAPIRIWIGNDFSTLEHRGRHFFEVVTDRSILSRLRERLHAESG